MNKMDSLETVQPGYFVATMRRLSVFWPLAGLVFVAHFFHLTQFGLYEDDYFYTLPIFGWDWSTWIQQIKNAILHPVQGRPLFLATNYIVLFLSLKGGGLELAYLFGWLIVSANAFLLFKFVERTVSQRAAVAAALFFIVYPIDTSRQILMHQVAIQGGMFCLLVALHLYLRGWIGCSFAVAAAGLLNYEAFYLPFLAVPLLVANVVRPDWRRLVKHGLLFFAVAFAALVVRRLLGEARAAELLGSIGEVLGKMLSAGPIGIWAAAKAAILRPADAFLHGGPLAFCLGMGIAIGTAVWLVRASRTQPAESGASVRPLLLVAVGGVLASFCSYVLAYRPDYYPPIMSIGRLTGVHTPGSLGAAICVGVATQIVWLAGRRWLTVGAAALLSLAIGFSTTFALELHRTEYVTQWSRQVAFFRQMIPLIADLQEGEIVVLNGEGDESVFPITQGFPRFGVVNYTPLSFAKYVAWPSTWKAEPRIAVTWPGFPVQTVPDGLALFTPPWRFQPTAQDSGTPLAEDVPVARNGAFIYLRARAGILERVTGPVEIRGHTLIARGSVATTGTNLRATALFDRIAGDDGVAEWFTLRGAKNYPR